MSKVKIQGNASGTGTLTISAPNTNTDRTLTLPDGAGEILLSDGDGSNLTGISGSSDAFWVRSSSGQAPVATNTYTKLNFDTEQIDDGSNYDTSTSKYTVPTTGYYFVGSKIWYDNYSQAALDVEVHIKQNGSNTNIFSITSHTSSGGYTGLHTSGIVYATANDYLEVYAWHNHGIDVTVMSNSSFFGYKIY